MTDLILQVRESSQVAEARRLSVGLAQRKGFDAILCGKLAIIVTECATNLVKHTTAGGEILVRVVDHKGTPGIELLVLDKGPGIANIAESLHDGYSTAGTQGTGLGAIIRMADHFDIYSAANLGTALYIHLWASPVPYENQPLAVGVVSLPYPGEEVCGDGWVVHQSIDCGLLMVVDGLGHGAGANDATVKATRAFHENINRPLTQLVPAIHHALKHTRGAVMALMEIDHVKAVANYIGIGNISSTIYGPDAVYNCVSHNGTVGFEMSRVQEFTYPCGEGSIVVMHSDGCTTQLSLSPYPGLVYKHPALIAGILYRDFNRGRDDVTVLVIRKH